MEQRPAFRKICRYLDRRARRCVAWRLNSKMKSTSAPWTKDEERLTALMAAARSGDVVAYEHLLIALVNRFRAFFRNRLRGRTEDFEDLVQDTLLAIHLRRDTYNPTMPLAAWSYAIARYKLIDYLRREGVRAHVSIDAVAELFCTGARR